MVMIISNERRFKDVSKKHLNVEIGRKCAKFQFFEKIVAILNVSAILKNLFLEHIFKKMGSTEIVVSSVCPSPISQPL
jgi:hypothetical protein